MSKTFCKYFADSCNFSWKNFFCNFSLHKTKFMIGHTIFQEKFNIVQNTCKTIDKLYEKPKNENKTHIRY